MDGLFIALFVFIFQDDIVVNTIGELFLAAVAEGKTKKIEALLRQGAEVNFKNTVSSVKK